MKRGLIVVLIALHFQACVQEKVVLEKPAVDKRVELMSIVFRLADKREYSSERFKLYVDRIEEYFEKYRNHELIRFTRSIINENDVDYDGPMWLAVHLDDDLNLLADVKDVWQLYPRWTEEIVGKFIPLLQKFCEDTRFDEFFKDNAGLYAEVIKRFFPIYEQVNPNWCFSFFGKEPKESFSIKIGMGVWGNYYGVNVDDADGNRKVYAIVGLVKTDDAGLPEFLTMQDLPIVIHEFSHPFVDGLIAKNREMFRESGEKIFLAVKDAVNIEAYPSWEAILDEALVHASTIRYMKSHGFTQSDMETWIRWLKEEWGFFWIEELVDELGNYEMQREKYPTLERYMPKLADACKTWTENIRFN